MKPVTVVVAALLACAVPYRDDIRVGGRARLAYAERDPSSDSRGRRHQPHAMIAEREVELVKCTPMAMTDRRR